jgi:hypothetical protein
MQHDLFILIAIFAGTIVILWLSAKIDNRAEAILTNWARKNSYKIISRRYPYFWEAAFYKGTRVQPKYIIKVEDSAGNLKSGYVIFGSWSRGISGDQNDIQAKVTWDT